MNPQLQDLKLVTQADVYCNESLAGYLTRQADGSVAFTYDENYLAGGRSAIATSLPVSREPYVGPGGRLAVVLLGTITRRPSSHCPQRRN
ncbi:HipA N-terminal domain-containing protein [Glutamicibacter halophytocola]|uniref:HipA N-terminal domain-containing protein n=1 Tax=Glutamicibacter halophytocola TaxID=1933880 RepID=UPI00321C33B3